MIDTNEILKEFEGLNLESKIIDIKDPWDGLYFLLDVKNYMVFRFLIWKW